MSHWSLDGVADNTWSSLDEVAWIECEDKGDRIIAESRLLRPTSCITEDTLQRSNSKSLQQAIKLSEYCDANVKEEWYGQGTTHETNYISEDTTVCSNGVAWCESTPSTVSLNTIDRAACTATSALEEKPEKGNPVYGYEGTMEMCKGESGYYSNVADIVNSSCHFPLSDICPHGGDLEFLAEEGQEDGRRDHLLEYGWGNTNNMEDIEKLFPRSTDSILTRGFDTETDGMLWEPPLGDSLGGMDPSAKVSVSPEFAARGDTKDMQIRVHFSSGNSIGTLTEGGLNAGAVVDDKQDLSSCLNRSSFSTHVDTYSNSGDQATWDTRLPHNHRSSAEYCKGSNNDVPHSCIDVQKASRTSGSSPSLSESEGSHAFKDGEKWKISKARRQGSRVKRLEENPKKPYGRTALSETIKAPLVYVPIVSSAQDSPPCSLPMSQIARMSACETTPPLQCLQPIPYVHAGYGLPGLHMPIMVPGPPPMVAAQQLPPQAQPVFIGYQSPPFIEVAKNQQCKSMSSQSPSASSTMTPQEKIEKLRWRQKMQAQLAIEQQQQQLINQRLIPEQTQIVRQRKQQPKQPQLNCSDKAQGGTVGVAQPSCAEPSVWNERPVSAEGASIDDGDESLAVTVLQQLLNIASKMDTRTRLCLRDGFRRLARNAMQRRAVGDRRGSIRSNTEPSNRACVAESSSSTEQAGSQRLLTVEDIVETETNPMDRFIAHFLFHKRCPPSSMPSYMSGAPCNMSQNSQPIVNQTVWAWQEANPLSPGVSPATHSSSYNDDLGTCNSPNVVTDTQASHPCLHAGKVVSLSEAAAMGSMQHPMDREMDMIDMDTALPEMVEPAGNVDSLDDVKEPVLQAK